MRIAHGETVASHVRGGGLSRANRANARRTLFEDDGDYAACGAVNWNLTPCQNSKGYGAMILRKADGVMM